jgi:hypothetical protein
VHDGPFGLCGGWITVAGWFAEASSASAGESALHYDPAGMLKIC